VPEIISSGIRAGEPLIAKYDLAAIGVIYRHSCGIAINISSLELLNIGSAVWMLRVSLGNECASSANERSIEATSKLMKMS
jgi:hypothetical protein